MHLGSKHESEASFSFQINDAVKDDEEYLLADDDFLRDVNDYTLTTPASPSRTSVLNHDQPLTLDHLTTATDGHAAVTAVTATAAGAASLPNSFTPSSPTATSVHHPETAVNRRLKTPKRTFAFPSKPSPPKTTRVTRSATKWPSPLRERRLPRVEASPAVARLSSLRAEIEMLGENDGISSDSAQQQQQDGLSSDKRSESGNRSPLNSNMQTPTQVESALPIIEEALTDKDEPYSGPLVTQSAPPDEPSVSSSSDPRDEPVSSYADENVENTPKLQEFTGSQNLIGGAMDEDGSFDKNNLKITATVTEDESLVAPLTLSQLSPRKRGPTVGSAELDLVMGSTAFVSPMRPARKRPVSAVEKDARREPNKKGKTLFRTSTAAKSQEEGVNSSRTRRRRVVNPKADGKLGQGSSVVVGRRVNSASRLRSSRLLSSSSSSLSSGALASSSGQGQNQNQNQRTTTATRKRMTRMTTRARMARQVGRKEDAVGMARKRDAVRQPARLGVAEELFSADERAEEGTYTATAEDGTPVSSSDVVEANLADSPGVALKTESGKRRHARCNDHDTDQEIIQGTTTMTRNNHASLTKVHDFKFEFARRSKVDPKEDYGNRIVPGARQLRSQTRRMHVHDLSLNHNNNHNHNHNHNNHQGPTQRSALAPLLTLSGSRSTMTKSTSTSTIGSMTRSEFQYVHHKPVPDFRSQHALLESSSRARLRQRQQREKKENVVPLAFELHTDVRARERERFDAMVKEREREMEVEREVKRREREEEEVREVREMRRRAVPKAHVVPEWYKNAPRRTRKGRAGGGGGGTEPL